MRTFTPTWLAATVLSLATVASGATVGITDITGASLTSNGTVNSIAVTTTGGPDTVLQSELINVTLTGYTDADAAQLTVTDGGSVPSPVASVVEDFSIDSGIANMSSATFTFNAPVANRPGADIILVDVGQSSDALTVTIAGESDSISAGSHDFVGFGGRAFDIYQSDDGGPFNTVADLNGESFTISNSSSNSSRNFILIELDDYLVAEGASVTELTITASVYDPMAVFGLVVPTPAALPAGLAMLGLVAARRRRR